MSTSTSPARAKSGPRPDAGERAFEAVWSELESRHAWRITEARVDNSPVARSNLPYAWQDYDNRRAAAFRERHRLEELIADAADDWEAIVRLRHWAFTHVTDGSPSFSTSDPVAIVDSSLTGATFYCTHFAYAFVAAAAALGFAARHLGIDCEHTADEASTHHGIADVWVSSLRKWVALDPNYDSHYELDGVPLNAEEVGQRWRTHRGAGIRASVGPDRREVERARQAKVSQHEACAYFWHYIDTINDVFHRRGQHWPGPVVFLVDEARRAQTWYQGSPPNTYKHGRYENGSFLTTERLADAYPDLDCTRLVLAKPGKMPCFCRVKFGATCIPNFSHYEGRVDGGDAFHIDGVEYPWRLHPGTCSLEVRAVNTAGRRGPPSLIEVEIERDEAREPVWPEASM